MHDLPPIADALPSALTTAVVQRRFRLHWLRDVAKGQG